MPLRGRACAPSLCALLLAVAPAAAEDGLTAAGLNHTALTLDRTVSAEIWMARMHRAMAVRPFTGTFVYLRDGQLDALRIERKPDAQGGATRLSSLSGEATELISDAQALRLAALGGASLAQSGLNVPRLPLLDEASGAYYQLQLGGEDRVAGRQAQIVEIRPSDGFRYGYRLWLDAGSALLLKSLTVGPDSRAIEQLMFTELNTADAGDDSEPAAAAPPPSIPEPSPASAQTSDWQVLDAPDGFLPRLVSAGASTHLLFTDGLARVSVYIEPMAADRPTLSGPLSRGALNVFGRVAHGQQIIVMGDAPAATIERLAQGVVPVSPADSATP